MWELRKNTDHGKRFMNTVAQTCNGSNCSWKPPALSHCGTSLQTWFWTCNTFTLQSTCHYPCNNNARQHRKHNETQYLRQLYVLNAVFLLFRQSFPSHRNNHFIMEKKDFIIPLFSFSTCITLMCPCIVLYWNVWVFKFLTCWPEFQKNSFSEFWLWIRNELSTVSEMASNVFVSFCAYVKWCC